MESCGERTYVHWRGRAARGGLAWSGLSNVVIVFAYSDCFSATLDQIRASFRSIDLFHVIVFEDGTKYSYESHMEQIIGYRWKH